MDKIEYEILSLLKKRFISLNNRNKDDFQSTEEGEKVERTEKKNGVEKTRTVYKSNMKRYDCFQMFKHLLACYNYCTEHKNVKKLTLVNCVWELNDPTLIQSEKMRNEYIEMLETEHREFKSFKSYAEFVKKLFKNNTGTDFEVVYYSFADFSNMIDLSIREKEYLKRYIF